MSTSIFITGFSVAIIYLLFKFIEMRFILKENKPLKILFRDTLIVYLSVIIGDFVINQWNPTHSIGETQIFTNSPEF